MKIIYRVIKDLFNTEYRKGLLYILSSKLTIILFIFLTTPILSRLYSPADYGLFGLMNSITHFLVLLTSLALPQSLLTVNQTDIKTTTQGIFGYSLLTNIVFIIIAAIASSLFPITYINLEVIVMIGLTSWFITVTQVFANLNIRERYFGKNAIVNLLDNSSIRLSSVSLGLLGLTNYGLYVGEMVGKGINLVQQLVFQKSALHVFKQALNLSNIVKTIKYNRSYPFYTLPTLLIGNFSSQLIIWILALIQTNSSVGYFNMAMGLLNVPLLLFANSFQPIITSKFIETSKSLSYSLLWRSIGQVAIVGSLVYLGIFILAPYFVKFYLGPIWATSVDLVQILCMPFILLLFGNSISGVFIIFNQQRNYFFIKLIFVFILGIGLLFFLDSETDIRYIVIWYAAIVSTEEIVKILYISTKLRHVSGSSIL